MAVTLIVIGILVFCMLLPLLALTIIKMLPKRQCRYGCGSMGWDVLRRDHERKHCRCRKCEWVHEKPRSYLV